MTSPGASDAPAGPVPAVIIGGYLGAGKTTLVNHLLRHAGGRRIAVLVNDFGEVSIDADLIVGADGEVLDLAGGCVCCSFGADLVGTLQRVLERDPPPEVVLIETSGVGLPAAVARSARLVQGLRIDGIVVVADAQTLGERAADRYVGDTVRQQLRDADLLVLNKTDLVEGTEAAALRDWLATQGAPGTRVLEAQRAGVMPEVVLGIAAVTAARAGGVEGPSSGSWAGSRSGSRTGSGGGSPPDGAPAEARPLALPVRPADAGFESGVRLFEGPVDIDALVTELAAPGSRVVRAKGVLTDLQGRRQVLQMVGRRAEVTLAPSRDPAPVDDAGEGGQAARANVGRTGRLVWIRTRA